MATNISRIITTNDKTASIRLKAIYQQKKHSLNITQNGLAELTGWTQGYISHCMTSRVSMSMERLLKWAAILEVDVLEIDPNFTKRFPRMQEAKVPLLAPDQKIVGVVGRFLTNQQYAYRLEASLGFIPAQAILHIDPDRNPKVGNIVACVFFDLDKVIFGKLSQIQKTQIKLETEQGTLTLPLVDLESFHPAARIDLPG